MPVAAKARCKMQQESFNPTSTVEPYGLRRRCTLYAYSIRNGLRHRVCETPYGQHGLVLAWLPPLLRAPGTLSESRVRVGGSEVQPERRVRLETRHAGLVRRARLWLGWLDGGEQRLVGLGWARASRLAGDDGDGGPQG